MKKLIAALVIGVSANAHALSVSDFESLVHQEQHGSSTQAAAARMALAYYFAAIADLLNGVRGTSGELYYAGPQKICLPSGVALTGPVVRELTKNQIDKAEGSGTFKADWKSSNINLFVYLALALNYPCVR